MESGDPPDRFCTRHGYSETAMGTWAAKHWIHCGSKTWIKIKDPWYRLWNPHIPMMRPTSNASRGPTCGHSGTVSRLRHTGRPAHMGAHHPRQRHLCSAIIDAH